ncbi:thioredoxin-dependent thiol peroxidase [Micrococcoides hystricis]|uniref:thioredoxin-dependent peroxiredoxin n=1 Tax=Micrococcoides hystricis TaxID=1572761 RepID=A0ABV6PEN9_9MICC
MSELTVGAAAPDFTLNDAEGNEVSLADYAGKNVVLYFYPKAATPGCTTEACDFRDNLNALKGAGYQVIGISPDSPEDIKAFAEAEGLNFPLLSDPGAETAKAYGSFGEKTINGKTFDGTLRSTFVIDGNARVTKAEYNVDADGHVARLRDSLGV